MVIIQEADMAKLYKYCNGELFYPLCHYLVIHSTLCAINYGEPFYPLCHYLVIHSTLCAIIYGEPFYPLCHHLWWTILPSVPSFCEPFYPLCHHLVNRSTLCAIIYGKPFYPLCHHLCKWLLCWGLTSQSTIFQSCRDGAIASWVINQYFRGVKCLAQGHNTAAVGFEPRTSRSGVRHSTTEPPRSPLCKWWTILPSMPSSMVNHSTLCAIIYVNGEPFYPLCHHLCKWWTILPSVPSSGEPF